MILPMLLAAALAAPGDWTTKTSGGVVTLTPANLAAGEVAVIEVHPVESARDPRAWVNQAWEAFKKSYTGLQGEAIAQQRNPANLVTVTASASMVDAANREFYVVLYGVGQADRIQPVLFVAGSFQAFQEYGPTATKVVNAISALGPPGERTFVASLHPFLPDVAAPAVAAAAPALAAVVPAAPPPPAAAPADAPDDFREDKSYGVFLADSRVIAEGVNVSLIGEWRADLKNITLRLRQDGTYALRTGAAVAFVNSNTGTFSHAVAAIGTETGTWTFADGVLTLTPASRESTGVNGYGPATNYTAPQPDPPRSLHVTGVTIQYTPMHTNLTRTRPGLHVIGPPPPGEGADWDLVLRSAPWSG